MAGAGRVKRFRVEQREDGSAWWVFDFELAEYRPKSHVEDFQALVDAVKYAVPTVDREWDPELRRWAVNAQPVYRHRLSGIFRNFGEELGKLETQGCLL